MGELLYFKQRTDQRTRYPSISLYFLVGGGWEGGGRKEGREEGGGREGGERGAEGGGEERGGRREEGGDITFVFF